MGLNNMGLEDFSDSNHGKRYINGDDEDVRPRVSESTHEDVRDFTARSGLNISEAYDYLVGAALSDQDILEEILTLDKEYQNQMSSMQKELLKDIVVKWNSLGHFPDREEINSASDMNGFPIYILHLGKSDRIKKLVEDHFPEKIN